MSLKCTECNRVFSIKSNLTRHLRMVHNIEVERIDILPRDFDVYHYKCLEGCNISFKYNRELRKHLHSKHEICLMELHLEFPNLEEFHKWLRNEETNNFVQYVHLTATKRKTTGAETYYYECSRTGKRSHVDDSHRKRRARKWVTKLNRGCTSQMIVNKLHDGSCTVIYYKTHYGHETNLEHVRLSKEDRGSIASKLLLGLPVSTILNSARNPTDDNMKRINLLAKKDIANIRKSFNIDLRDGRFANFDTINVNSFITECGIQEYNPVLYSNIEDFPESEEICFMIMTKYQSEILSAMENNVLVVDSIAFTRCDFELITIFLVGESWPSFPAACLFTNRVHFGTYKLFFDKIKQRVGVLSPDLLVTNCNEMYHRAWESVMGAVRNIYNPSDIDTDFKLNLNRVICNETDVTQIKRKWIYDTVKSLQCNRDKSDFFENFEATVKVLRSDRDFTDFLRYFLQNYSDAKKWADCYRIDLDLPTRQLQVVSDVLKQYLDEGVDMRIDKIFHSLIRFIRDETVNSMVTKANRVFFVNENDKRHGLLMDKAFSGTHTDENLWTVEENEKHYVVRRYLEKKCCNLICTTCHICLHSFSCSCVDFFVGNAICVHIHYIWVTYFQSIVQNDDSDDHEPTYDEEIIIQVDENPQDDGEVFHMRNAVVERSAILCGKVASVQNKKALKIILDTLEQLCDLSGVNRQLETSAGESDLIVGDHSYL